MGPKKHRSSRSKRRQKIQRNTSNRSQGTRHRKLKSRPGTDRNCQNKQNQNTNSKPATGVLVGYSMHFQTKALITFSAKNGIQVWYKHEGDCKNCEQLQTCKETLLAEAKERNIPTPENPESIVPSEFAKTLFSKITGENEKQ